MRRKYLRADLARDLGLSKASITVLAKRGMPTHSRDAADAWRRTYLHPQWMKPPAGACGATLPVDPAPDDRSDALLAIVNRLAALAAVDLASWREQLRDAMRDLPQVRWHEVSLSIETWEALLATALPLIGEFHDADAPPDTPEDEAVAAQWMYALACELAVVNPAPAPADA